MQCVILAGGLAARMRPLTEKIPKALIEINGKPFIDYQLELLTNNGVTSVLLCIGHLGEMIKDHVGDSFNGVNIRYQFDGEKLLGTGGALGKAKKECSLEKNFGVIYGDSYLPINFSEVYDKFTSSNKHDAIMTIFKNDGLFDKSNVIIDGDNILYDKKYNTRPASHFNYIDYGFSILSLDSVDVPLDTKFGLDQLLHRISLNGKLGWFEVNTRFFEIGSFEGLKDFRGFVSGRK